ncbi:MAG: hypothetical protein H6835_06800 [Planctomycetes bacterium]|nr:hypothetical protein [Planctomycetota bacterium]
MYASAVKSGCLASLLLAPLVAQSSSWFPAPVLGPRSGQVMVFDAARQRVVLFVASSAVASTTPGRGTASSGASGSPAQQLAAALVGG